MSPMTSKVSGCVLGVTWITPTSGGGGAGATAGPSQAVSSGASAHIQAAMRAARRLPSPLD